MCSFLITIARTNDLKVTITRLIYFEGIVFYLVLVRRVCLDVSRSSVRYLFYHD